MYADSLPSPPSTIYTSIVDTVSRRITFTWSPVTPGCQLQSIVYYILASNCGSCPTTTNQINATCTDVPTGPSANSTTACTFALQAIICDFVIGRRSSPITVLLEGSPSVTTTQAHYKTSIALACIFAAGLMMSIAALATTIIIVITCYRKRVTVVKRESTPELATPIATDLDLEIPYHENNDIVMESSSLEDFNSYW